MIVIHTDEETGVVTCLQDDLKYPNGPLSDDPSDVYNYWQWKVDYLRDKFHQTKGKSRQDIYLQLEKAKVKFNKAKRSLFG